MNNGIITYDKQVLFKLLNDNIKKLKDNPLDIPIISNNVEVPLDIDDNDEFTNNFKLNREFQEINRTWKESKISNTPNLNIEDFSASKNLLDKIKVLYKDYKASVKKDNNMRSTFANFISNNDTKDISKAYKDVKTLFSALNITRNLVSCESNDNALNIQKIRDILLDVKSQDPAVKIVTDIASRYRIIFNVLKKSFKTNKNAYLSKVGVNVLKDLNDMKSILGNISNINVKNSETYITNFINNIAESKPYIISSDFYQLFKVINSKRMAKNINNISYIYEIITEFDANRIGIKNSKLKRVLKLINELVHSSKLKISKPLENKEDIFENIDIIRNYCLNSLPEPYSFDMPYSKKHKLNVYIVKNYKIIHDETDHIIHIIDSGNFELILKSLERINNLALYYTTNALNSDPKTPYPYHKKTKELIKWYINFLLDRYDSFIQNKFDLNKLPRYFFDFSDLLISIISNTSDATIQFSKVEKILKLFKEKSYSFSDELIKAKELIENFGFEISYNISKIYKILTTPDYNYLSALSDLEDTFSKDSGYDKSTFNEFDALQIREFAKNFKKAYGFLPNLEYTNELVKLATSSNKVSDDLQGLRVNINDIKEQEKEYNESIHNWDAEAILSKNLTYWKDVKYQKNFPYMNYSSFFELESKDKRRILLKNTFYKDFINKGKEKIRDRSEIINMIMSEDNSSIETFKDNLRNHIYPKEIPVVLAYKDEIHKPNSRLFFMAPTEFRYICSELEYNMEKVLNLKNGNSMTSGFKIINEKLEKVASVTGINERYLKLIISFDLKKLSTRFPRAIIKHEFEKLSRLFGEDLINSIYECIEKTVVYHVSNNIYYSFKPKHGCYEGFLNKFWTSYHIDVMTYTVYKLRKENPFLNTLHYSLNVFSDDGVLCCYQDPDSKVIDYTEIKNYNNLIYTNVKQSYSKLGLILSEDKTFVSDNFATFLNKIFYNGSQVNNDIKSFIRISDYQCNKVLTLKDKIRNLYSTIQGSLTNGTGIFHCYVVFYFKILCMLEQNYVSFSNKDKFSKIIFLLSPCELGGLGLGSIYKLCSSLEYDDLSMCINNLLHVAFLSKDKQAIGKINNILNQELRCHSDLPKGSSIFSSNFSNIIFSDEFLDRVGRKTLAQQIKNRFLKSLYSKEADDDFNQIYSLLYSTPYVDVVLFETILSLTPSYYFNTIFKGIEKIDTIKYFIRYKNCYKLQRHLFKIDNFAIEKFMKLMKKTSRFTSLFINVYNNSSCVFDVGRIISNEDAYKITLRIRKRYLCKEDIIHSTEVCCSNGIFYNSKLQKELFTKVLENYEERHNIIDNYLGYDEDKMNIPIFSYISRTNKIESFDYINSYNIVNLKSFNIKTKSLQEVENPNFFEFSEIDSIIKRIYILDNLVDRFNIPIRRPLLILHATWGIPYCQSNQLFSFDVSRNFLAHFLIKKSKHTFLGLRTSSSIQIINARGVSKHTSSRFQNFDIYRYLLTLRIFMSCELEIQSMINFRITKVLPLFVFNLCTQFYDPDDLLMTELSKSDYYKFYSHDEEFIDYLNLVKKRPVHAILRSLIFKNTSELTIWDDLNNRINNFMSSNFEEHQAEYLKDISNQLKIDNEDFSFLNKLPDITIESVVMHDFKYYGELIKKDKRIQAMTGEKVNKKKSHEVDSPSEGDIKVLKDTKDVLRSENNKKLNKILEPDDNYFFHNEIIDSDKFDLRNKLTYLDRLDINDVLKGIMCYILHNINLKKIAFENKSQSMKGKERSMLTKFGLLISNILYKGGTYNDEADSAPFQYSDLNHVKKILIDCNFSHYFRRTILDVLSFNKYLMNNALSHLEESLIANDTHFDFANCFINMIRDLWATRLGKLNPAFTWRFFLPLKANDKKFIMMKQMYEYFRFTNAIYKIYYKSKLNNLSVEISKIRNQLDKLDPEKNLERYNSISDRLNNTVRNRTLTQLKKSFLNIRTCGGIDYDVGEEKYTFNKDNYEISFIRQLNAIIQKFCKRKNQDDDHITGIVYINDEYIEFTSERDKDLNIMFNTSDELGLLNKLFFDYKKFFESDVAMLNLNIIKFKDSVDTSLYSDYIITNYIPNYSYYKDNNLDTNRLIIEMKVVKTINENTGEKLERDIYSYYKSYIDESTQEKTRIESKHILDQAISKISSVTNQELSIENIKISKAQGFKIIVEKKPVLLEENHQSSISISPNLNMDVKVNDNKSTELKHESRVNNIELFGKVLDNIIEKGSIPYADKERDIVNKSNEEDKVDEHNELGLEDELDLGDIVDMDRLVFGERYKGTQRIVPYNKPFKDIYDLIPPTIDTFCEEEIATGESKVALQTRSIKESNLYRYFKRLNALEKYLLQKYTEIREYINNNKFEKFLNGYKKYAKSTYNLEISEFFPEEIERFVTYILNMKRRFLSAEELNFISSKYYSQVVQNYFIQLKRFRVSWSKLYKSEESDVDVLTLHNVTVEHFLLILEKFRSKINFKKMQRAIFKKLYPILGYGKEPINPVFIADVNFVTYEVELCPDYSVLSIKTELDRYMSKQDISDYNYDNIASDRDKFCEYYCEFRTCDDYYDQFSGDRDKLKDLDFCIVCDGSYTNLYSKQLEIINTNEIITTITLGPIELFRKNSDFDQEVDLMDGYPKYIKEYEDEFNFKSLYKYNNKKYILNFELESKTFLPLCYSNKTLREIEDVNACNIQGLNIKNVDDESDNVTNIIEKK